MKSQAPLYKKDMFINKNLPFKKMNTICCLIQVILVITVILLSDGKETEAQRGRDVCLAPFSVSYQGTILVLISPVTNDYEFRA